MSARVMPQTGTEGPVGKWVTHLDPTPFQTIRGKHCLISLELRPHYCDRGRYIAKVFVTDYVQLSLDGADGFPRYYFFEHNAKVELEEWLRVRGEV